MIEKFRVKLNELFENAPQTSRARELKEELLANLMDRYNDLLASGKSEEEAFNIAIAGIGDIDEIIIGLKDSYEFNPEQMRKDREKRAFILSTSIGMYIMSVVILIMLTSVFRVSGDVAICIMLTIDALATSLLIYNAVSRPKYIKADDTIVEEFKEWKSANNTEKEVINSIKSIMWLVIITLYFLLSFTLRIWSFSWILFIIGAAIERVITLIFQLRKQRE
ncbi:permease prefix domain 1-containing protein [Clostridium sp. UBA4548]|uniref:permease prefix domain 1-containing protein n=1 Tax=Clostridium sp. UBA4548 TaxID=1946361 RepID=UPI0025BB95D3|nr:permease prefix domain 1-containing protein [Clostridium sp. UBA4548]